MNWEAGRFCSACHVEVDEWHEMYSGGVCPHCGVKQGLAIVKTYPRMRRWEQTAPWWKFWGSQGHWEYKDKN